MKKSPFMNHLQRAALAASMFLPAFLAAGQNLLYNSSFELGAFGWDNGQISAKTLESRKNLQVRKVLEVPDAPHGRKVIQIDVGGNYAGGWPLVSGDVRLTPGKKYTMSFYVKPETSRVICCSMHTNHYGNWSSASGMKKFNVTPGKWQRVSHTFTYQPKQVFHDPAYHAHFFLMQFYAGQGKYLFDAIQLEEGDLTGYKPASPVECAVSIPERYITEEKIEADISAVSYAGKTAVKRELVLKDTGKNTVLKKESAAFSLVPFAVQNQKFTFKVPYGGFQFHAAGEPKAVSADFVRIHPNNAVYEKGKFAVGIGSSSVLGLFDTPYAPTISLEYPAAAFHRDPGELVRLSGGVFDLSYDASITTFGHLLPEKRGQYNWSYLDSYFARLRELKLKSLATINTQSLMARNGKRDWGARVPGWLRKLDRDNHPEGIYRGGWHGVYIIAPPSDVVAEIAAEICARYSNDIVMFRLFAEANGYMPPKMLAEYAEAVYKAIKKRTPDLVVNNANITEDGGSVMGGYMEEFLKCGGVKYTDVLSFHPYRTSQDDSVTTAMDGIRSFGKIMKKFNVNFPLAETECFYLIANPYNGQPEATWANFEPAAVARRFLIDLGEGVILSTPLELQHVHKAPAANSDSSRDSFRRVPSANFAVHNAMGHFLNGAENPRCVKLPGKELCYVFENHGKIYSAVWCISDRSEMTVKLPSNMTCKVYDIYGNLMKTVTKEIHLMLDRRPQIIEWPGNSDADIPSFLRQGSYVPQQAVQFFGVQNCRGGILLLMANNAPKEISGFVRVSSPYLKAGKVKFSNLKARENAAVFIPAEIPANAPKSFKIKITCSAEGKLQRAELTLDRVPEIKLNQDIQFGPHSLRLAQKDGKLLLTFRLKSAKTKQPDAPNQPWTGDSVEIFADYAPGIFNPADVKVIHDQCFQYIIPAWKNGVPPVTVLRDARPVTDKKKPVTGVSVERTADGAKVRAELPYVPGMKVNFHFNAEGKTMIFNGSRNVPTRHHYAVIAD